MNMLNNKHRSMRRSALAIALAVGLSASGVVLAQSTVATLYGNVDPGATIQVQNLGSGLTRTIAPAADGRFSASSLLPGRYRVTVTENGQAVTRDVQLVAGQGFNLDLVSAAANAQALEGVQVNASVTPPIDVSSVETTTVFTAQQIHNLPVARNQSAVALLSPGTVAAASGLGGGMMGMGKGNISPNLPVFNGASAAENSYYVNGFNVTNQFQTLTFSDVPFEGIEQEEVKSGGYGAQYGNSTGGVISVITKRGTNTWKGGAKVTYTPASLAQTAPTQYANNGTLLAVNNKDTVNQTVFSAWLGGPLVKDKLFVFALYQGEQQKLDTYGGYIPEGSSLAASAYHAKVKNPYWLVKLDWNINDNNILEYTGFNNTRKTTRDIYYLGSDADKEPVRGDYQGTEYLKNGGQVNILKYTGYLSDSLTLSAQYGHLENARDDYGVTADGIREYYDGNPLNLDQPGCARIVDASPDATSNGGTEPPITGCSFISTLNRKGGGDTRKNWRVDLEWLAGDHDLKVGYNRDDWNSTTGTAIEGGMLWVYYSRPAGGAPGTVLQQIFSTGASVDIVQDSYYLQDTWHISDNFLVNLGLRNDSFKNKNGDGETYVSQDNIWQPRLGFSWDVHGDSTLKVYGSFGDYSLPIAANVALRGASASVFHIEDFDYTQVDPETGVPLDPVSQGDGQYVNGEAGHTPPPGAVADRTLKPYQQREYILGAEQQVGDWTFGIKGIYRSLTNAIDDTCDFRPFQKWATDNGLDASGGVPETMPGCWLFNPGRGATFDIDVDGDGTLEHVVLSANDIGEQEAKRTYQALQLSAERVFDGKWYLKASYVWSRSKGNTEGMVKSDIGQTDTGTTQDFDYPELMIGSNGYLPNDRRHQLKVYGAWQATPQWLFGSTFQWNTGRPQNCIGVNPVDFTDNIGYRNSYFWCDGHVVPRGSKGTTPDVWNLGLTAVYTPRWAEGLRLQLDVDNVFNNHEAVAVNETGENGGGVATPNTYLVPTSWQAPRVFRFTASYDFSL